MPPIVPPIHRRYVCKNWNRTFAIHPFESDQTSPWKICIPLQNTSNSVKEFCVSIWWANLDFHATIEHHYGCDSFFEVTICEKYLFHLPFVHGIDCFGEIYEQKCHFEVFLYEILWFDGLSESMMWIGFSENRFDSSEEFSQFLVRCDWKVEHYKP